MTIAVAELADVMAALSSWCWSPDRLRPGPGADLGQVLAVLPGPGPVPGPGVHHVLPELASPHRQPRHSVDHVHHQVEPVHVVHHDHVEGRGGRALFLVAADMKVVMAGATVGKPVD